MFGRKKKTDDTEQQLDAVIETVQPSHEIMILVTEEDKTGRDLLKMSDFFSVALQGMSNELVSSDSLV